MQGWGLKWEQGAELPEPPLTLTTAPARSVQSALAWDDARRKFAIDMNDVM